MLIAFDTETTGKFVKRKPVNYEGNPRMVSMAILAFSDDGKTEVGQSYSVIRPDGFTIPADATAVHGISQEYAMANGISIKGVLQNFLNWHHYARLSIAFNNRFDIDMIMRELMIIAPHLVEKFDTSKSRCAMMAASACMKLPNEHGYPGYAWPKLDRAYQWMFGKPMEGAHNSMNDTRATAHLMFALQELNYWDIQSDRAFTAPTVTTPVPDVEKEYSERSALGI